MFRTSLYLSAALLCAFLLPHLSTPARPKATVSTLAKVLPKGPSPPDEIDSPEVQALDRLSRALGGIPLSSAGSILSEANDWLEAKGAAPCAVRFGEGQPALIVTGDAKAEGPLVRALLRCADAVEHVVP